MHSDYMDGIVIDPSIGTLVETPDALADPIVRYLKAKETGEVIGDPSEREAILHEIDERTFGHRMIDFYREALTIYHDDDDDDMAEQIMLLMFVHFCIRLGETKMIKITMFSAAETVPGQGVGSAYRELVNLLEEKFPNEFALRFNSYKKQILATTTPLIRHTL
ncbi:Uncharacterised protein [Weissella viridescens]|uniref:Uncharacterized protein n=1 Tax=Weissella viridescens TaxID=1629 RepID=A0A380NVZ6_WEIVI|nr:Uncharacterised protein [Weissella viridescens]